MLSKDSITESFIPIDLALVAYFGYMVVFDFCALR